MDHTSYSKACVFLIPLRQKQTLNIVLEINLVQSVLCLSRDAHGESGRRKQQQVDFRIQRGRVHSHVPCVVRGSKSSRSPAADNSGRFPGSCRERGGGSGVGGGVVGRGGRGGGGRESQGTQPVRACQGMGGVRIRPLYRFRAFSAVERTRHT